MDRGSGPPHSLDHTSSPGLLDSYHKLKCQAAIAITGAWLASVDLGSRPSTADSGARPTLVNPGSMLVPMYPNT